MANSGEIKTNVEYESWFWVRWSLKSQSIAENHTIINWSCGVTPGHKFGDNAIKMSAVTINGVQVYSGGKYSDFLDYKEHTLGSGELKIQHDSDGKKSFSISSFTGWLYSNHNYKSDGAKYDLPAIPRQATITAADDFTDLDNPTIKYSNPAGNAVTELMACISLTGAVADIQYRAIPKTGNTYTFPLTDDERDVLRNNTVNEREVIYHIRTRIGDGTYYSTLKKKLTIAESEYTKPTVSMDVSINNGYLPSKFADMYIQGKSRVDVKISAEGKYNATIEDYVAMVDGEGYYSSEFTSNVIESSGDVFVMGQAKDSRGFTNTPAELINVVEYSKPLVIPVDGENSVLCYRSDLQGNRTSNSTFLWIKATKSYYDLSGVNTCRLQWRLKPATDQWDDAEHRWAILPEVGTGLVHAGLDLKESYTVQIRAIDDIGEYSLKTFDVPTVDVALHLGKGGKNVTVGTYCDYTEEYTFRSAWKAIFDLDVNGLYIRTVDVSGTDHIYIKTKYDDFSGTGESRQSFFIFGTANLIPLNGTGFVASDGNTDWVGTTSIGLSPLSDGVLQVTLPSVSHDAFAIISAYPFEIVYL